MKTSLPLLCITVLLMAACAPQTRIDSEPPQARQARQLQSAGDYRQAASLWEQLAQHSATPTPYLLNAAENWVRAGETFTAQDLLQNLAVQDLSKRDQQRYYLLQAEMALQQRRYDLARQALRELPDKVAGDLRQRHTVITDELAAVAQGPAGAYLRELLHADSNQQGSFQADLIPVFVNLARLPTAELDQFRLLRTDAREQAWLDLALLARRTLLQRQATGDALNFWWNSHFSAGPNPNMASAAVAAFHQSYTYPSKIAVLLPLRGSLKNAAAAIRDGMLTAWAALPENQRPQLHFLSLDDRPESAVGALLEAHEQGHRWVVGPLRRETVNAVVDFPGNTLPLLLLNRPDAGIEPPPGLPVYSFALAPEDEAIASAEMALRDGHQRALVLHSDDAWGERVARAFSEHFTDAGGQILRSEPFNPEESNHSPQLRSLLGLNEAEARYRRIRGLLGLPVGFTAVPRQDADLVFLGARVNQARQLRPQLRFFDAGHLPVFATHQVYTGRDDPRNDRDLNGIQFPISPWLLDAGPAAPTRAQSAQWFDGLDNLGNAQLYALGLDVMRILPYLHFLQNDPGSQLRGAHGQLSVNRNGQVMRQFSAAQFHDGQVRLQNPPSPAATPDNTPTPSAITPPGSAAQATDGYDPAIFDTTPETPQDTAGEAAAGGNSTGAANAIDASAPPVAPVEFDNGGHRDNAGENRGDQ